MWHWSPLCSDCRLRVIPDPHCALRMTAQLWRHFPLASHGSGVADTRPGPRIRMHHQCRDWVLLDLRRHRETAPPDEIVALTLILAQCLLFTRTQSSMSCGNVENNIFIFFVKFLSLWCCWDWPELSSAQLAVITRCLISTNSCMISVSSVSIINNI